jgi:hypothetical protein
VFKRKIEYMAKLYLVSDVRDMPTALHNDLHQLIYKRGGTFSGGGMHHAESDGWGYITSRYRTSSPTAARQIFDEWLEGVLVRDDLTVTGSAFGSIETGWQVHDVQNEDESREEAHTREWMRRYHPKGYKELYGTEP